MTFIKKWWMEVLLLVGLVLVLILSTHVDEILTKYDAKAPALFYLITEFLWDSSAAMFLYKWVGVQFFDDCKRKGLLATLKTVSSLKSIKRPDGAAWTWFRINRSVALVQPGITAVMVLFTAIPFAVKGVLFAVLIFDMAHTVAVVIRSKTWQTSD